MAEWLNDAVFYEIYPQSFQDSNDDGIGDFKGIQSRLDYIKELGCNAIWMNPCFKSPFKDAGYDVADYYQAAPRYGTNEDLKELIDAIHAKGMKILLDLVPGHTSVEHDWFKQSMKPERNEFTDRYVWTDSVWNAPANLATIRGISDRDGSAVVNFFSAQPALNYGFYNQEEPWQQAPTDEGPAQTLEAMMDVMRFWLDQGVDGFRVDMAGSLVKNDPESEGTIALWQKVRDFLEKEYPDAVMVSEWGEPDKSLKGGFHMDFLLHFGPSHYNDLFRCDHPYFSSEGQGVIKDFIDKYVENYNKTNGKGLICIPSGNHDMDRLARRLNPKEQKIAFDFLLTMPGAPFIYYGDEIGMHYVEGLNSVEGGYNRTGSRSPMQWNHDKNDGFSTAEADQLYIKMDEAKDRPVASDQIADENSIYHEVKRLIEFRKAHPALLANGSIEFLTDGYPLTYLRKAADGSETLLVVINPDKQAHSIPVPEGKWTLIYRNGTTPEQEVNEIHIPGQTAVVYQLEQA